MSGKGARQRRFRQRQKDHHQATQRQLQELSERVSILEVEREQLRGALGTACGDVPDRQSNCSTAQLPDQQETALTLCFGEATLLLQLTRGSCRALTADAVADIWKRLVHRMSWNLDSVATFHRANDHKQQTEDLVHEAISFMWALVDHNPGMLNELVTINVEDPADSGNDPRDWPAILAAMQLEEGQAEQALVTRRTVLRELGALFADCEQMLARLQGMQDVEERTEGAAMHFTEAASLMEQLRDNVHALHVCRSYHLSHIYNRVLSPVQVARYFQACLPMGPDTLSLLTCLANQSNEPSTDDVLRAEAAARAGVAGSGPGQPAGDWRRAFALPLCELHAWPGRPPVAVAPSAEARRMAGAAAALAGAGSVEPAVDPLARPSSGTY